MNQRGNTKHGQHGTLTYARWKSMHQRCRSSNPAVALRYAERGILVCARWLSFEAFLADMGECPSAEMTLDRKDNALGYQPGNCRWVTQAEQNANRTIGQQLTFHGVTQNATAWARALGMQQQTLAKRLKAGWSVEDALTRPVRNNRCDP